MDSIQVPNQFCDYVSIRIPHSRRNGRLKSSRAAYNVFQALRHRLSAERARRWKVVRAKVRRSAKSVRKAKRVLIHKVRVVGPTAAADEALRSMMRLRIEELRDKRLYGPWVPDVMPRLLAGVLHNDTRDRQALWSFESVVNAREIYWRIQNIAHLLSAVGWRVNHDIVRKFGAMKPYCQYREYTDPPLDSRLVIRELLHDCIAHLRKAREFMNESRWDLRDEIMALLAQMIQDCRQVAVAVNEAVDWSGVVDESYAGGETLVTRGPRVLRGATHADAMEAEQMGQLLDKIHIQGGVQFSTSQAPEYGHHHDSPGMLQIAASSAKQCDVVREITSMAFKRGDRVGSSAKVFAQDPKIDVTDILGRIKIPQRLGYFEWSVSETAGTEKQMIGQDFCNGHIYVTPAQPRYMSSTKVGQSGLVAHTMLSFYAEMFTYWRGSLKYTIETIPTKFHQGQLFVAFLPGPVKDVTMTKARNCYAATLDLSTSNRTEFVVPYINRADVLPISRLCGSESKAWHSCLDPNWHYTGKLAIFIQNPLAAPSSVSDKIDVNVYVQATDDFRFFVPRMPRAWITRRAGEEQEMVQLSGDMHSETITNQVADAPVKLPITGFNPNTEEQVAKDCNVAQATLETVVQRDYMLQTGITWSSTAHMAIIFRAPVEGLFDSTDLSIRGLMNYHYYTRLTFEVTARMNASPMYAGALKMIWLPRKLVETEMGYLEGSIDQAPSAMLLPASETNATIKIPWAQVMRLYRVEQFLSQTPFLGMIYLIAWNPLRCPATGPQSLSVTLWGHVEDPYIGVKRPVESANEDGLTRFVTLGGQTHAAIAETIEAVMGVTELQESESTPERNDNTVSDSAMGTASGGSPFKPLRPTRWFGDIRTNHMNVLDLLKRPNFTHYGFHPTKNWESVYRFGYPIDKMAQNLLSTYAFWSGSERYWFGTDTGITHDSIFAADTEYGYPHTELQRPHDTVEIDWPDTCGGVIWHPYENRMKVLSVPYYAATPACSTRLCEAYELDEFDFYSWQRTTIFQSVPQAFSALVGWSAGDDYDLYMPVPLGNFNWTVTEDPWEDLYGVNGYAKLRGKPHADFQDDVAMPDATIVDEVDAWFLKRAWTTVSGAIVDTFKFLAEMLKKPFRAAAFESFKSRLEQTRDIIITRVLPVVTWAIDFILNLFIILTDESSIAKGLALTSLTTKCAVAYFYGTDLLEQLTQATEHTSFLEGKEAVLSGVIATALVAGVVSFLGYGLSTGDSKTIRERTAWKLAETCAAASKVSQAVKNVPDMWTTAHNGIKCAIEYILDGKPMFADWYNDRREAIAAWQRSYDTHVVAGRFLGENIFKIDNGMMNIDRLRDLVPMAQEIRGNQGGVKQFPVTWSKTAETVITAIQKVERLYTMTAQRVEPIGIYVQGTPGCGKSLAWNKFLPFVILKELGLVETYNDVRTQVYSKPNDPEQKFMDGYTGQPWVGIDDFAACSDDRDVAQLINMISVANCPVNMADLEMKGLQFTSKFVCASSNTASVTLLNGIRDTSALTRRFPFAYRQTVRDNFATNGRLDVVKLNAHVADCEDRNALLLKLDDVWKFETLELNGGHHRDEVLLSVIVGNICDYYRRRHGNNDVMDTVLGRLHAGDEGEADILLRSMNLPDARRLEVGGMLRAERNHLSAQTFLDPGEVAPLSEAVVRRRMNMVFAARDEFINQNLDYNMAHAFVNMVRDDAAAFGYTNMQEIDNFLHGSAAPVTNRSFRFVPTEAFFQSFLRSLWRISGSRSDIGPPPKKWLGVMKWVMTLFGCAVVVTGVAYAIYKIVRTYLFDALEGTTHSKDYSGDKVYRAQPVKAPRMIQLQGKPNAGDDGFCKSIIKAVRKIECWADGKYHSSANAIALDAKTLLLNRHLLEGVRKRCPGVPITFYLQQVNRRGDAVNLTPFECDEVNVADVLCENFPGYYTDALIVRLVGANVNHARSIGHHFWSEQDLTYWRGQKVMASRLWGSPTSGILIPGSNGVSKAGGARDNVFLRYEASATKPGDCGSPIVLESVRVAARICGIVSIHETDDVQYIVPITSDAIAKARQVIEARCPIPTVAVEPNDMLSSATFHVSEKPGLLERNWHSPTMEVVGEVKANDVTLSCYNAPRTAFERSGLDHPDWIDNYGPSVQVPTLVGNDMVHPLYHNVQKFEPRIANVVPFAIHRNVCTFIKSKFPKDGGRVFSDYEAINGCGIMKPIVLETSTGYLSTWFSGGKKDLFTPLPQVENEDGSMSPQHYEFSATARTKVIPIWGLSFYDHYRRQVQLVEQGIEPETFWKATMKDELLKLKKLAICKTRVFIQPGLDYTLLMRKYFGDFSNYVKVRYGFDMYHGIGADKEAVWAAYHQNLKPGDGTRTCWWDVDAANWDGNVPVGAMDYFKEITDHFYGREGMKARHALLYNLFNSYIIVGQRVIQVWQGNKSGNPLTDVFNSMTNAWFMLCAFLWNCRLYGIDMTLADFDANVSFITYGDDVIVGTSTSVCGFYNRVTVAAVGDVLGMELTSAAKDDNMLPFEDLENLTFLKSRFVVDGDVVLAPMPKEVIYRELQWQRKANAGNVFILEQRIQTALQMMAHHGQHEVELLLRQLEDIGITAQFDYTQWRYDLWMKQQCAQFVPPLPAIDVKKFVRRWMAPMTGFHYTPLTGQPQGEYSNCVRILKYKKDLPRKRATRDNPLQCEDNWLVAPLEYGLEPGPEELAKIAGEFWLSCVPRRANKDGDDWEIFQALGMKHWSATPGNVIVSY